VTNHRENSFRTDDNRANLDSIIVAKSCQEAIKSVSFSKDIALIRRYVFNTFFKMRPYVTTSIFYVMRGSNNFLFTSLW